MPGASTTVTYADVRRMVAEAAADNAVIGAVDRIMSVSLLVAPLVPGVGAGAAQLLGLFDAKHELVRRANELVRALAGRRGGFLQRSESLAAGHLLITYTAFWSAVEERLGRRLLQIRPRFEGAAEAPPEPEPDGDECYAGLPPVSLPHPAATFRDEAESRRALYAGMARRLQALVRAEDPGATGFDELPDLAVRHYYAQYLDLMLTSRDFFTWAAAYEHAKTQALVADQSDALDDVLGLLRGVDVGLRGLHGVLRRRDERSAPRDERAAAVVGALARVYADRVEDKVIRDDFARRDGGPVLDYPAKQVAFIPQRYRELRHADGTNLEDERLWNGVEPRDDVASAVLRHLASPYSADAPLLVLGQPGSGKSLLTEMLAARLAASGRPVVRVVLRDVDPDSSLPEQIERQIYADTRHRIEDWASFSAALAGEPLVVILDGYDELLQASGRVFGGYLEEVHRFQRAERRHERPVRIVVTSRITLIDRVRVPADTSVLRLLEFDAARQAAFAERWNEVNGAYLEAAGAGAFAVPPEPALQVLAGQPLLLLMLAIHAATPQARPAAGLDRTLLYHSLLCRFVERERGKDPAFADLDSAAREAAVDADLRRLGVAAIGMFCRESLHVTRAQLGADLEFAGLSRATDGTGVRLTDGEIVFGGFFFIHESRSRAADDDPAVVKGSAAAFEFLHATFGEFLAADHLVRLAVRHAHAAALLDGDLFTPDRWWYAALSQHALHTRPAILSMMHDWLPHRLALAGLSQDTFEAGLRRVVDRQVGDVLGTPPRWFVESAERRPYPPLPMLGGLAVYSLNLMVLAAWLNWGHRLAAADWDRLAHLWRSWFPLAVLSALARQVHPARVDATVTVHPGDVFDILERSDLDRLAITATVLADNLAAGAAWLAVERFHGIGPHHGDDPLHALERAGIDVRWERLARRVRDGALGPDETPPHPTPQWSDPLPGAAVALYDALAAQCRFGAVPMPDAPIVLFDIKDLAWRPRGEVESWVESEAARSPWAVVEHAETLLHWNSEGFLEMPIAAPLLRSLRAFSIAKLELAALISLVPSRHADLETAAEFALGFVEERDRDVADAVLAGRLHRPEAAARLPESTWLDLLQVTGAEGNALPRTTARLTRHALAGRRDMRSDLAALVLTPQAWVRLRGSSPHRHVARSRRAAMLPLLARAARRWGTGTELFGDLDKAELGELVLLDDDLRWLARPGGRAGVD